MSNCAKTTRIGALRWTAPTAELLFAQRARSCQVACAGRQSAKRPVDGTVPQDSESNPTAGGPHASLTAPRPDGLSGLAPAEAAASETYTATNKATSRPRTTCCLVGAMA